MMAPLTEKSSFERAIETRYNVLPVRFGLSNQDACPSLDAG